MVSLLVETMRVLSTRPANPQLVHARKRLMRCQQMMNKVTQWKQDYQSLRQLNCPWLMVYSSATWWVKVMLRPHKVDCCNFSALTALEPIAQWVAHSVESVPLSHGFWQLIRNDSGSLLNMVFLRPLPLSYVAHTYVTCHGLCRRDLPTIPLPTPVPTKITSLTN